MALQGALPVFLAVLLASTSSFVKATKQPDNIGDCANIPGYDVLPNTNVDAAAAPQCRHPDLIPVPDAAAFAAGCDQSPTCRGFAYSKFDGVARQLFCTRPTTAAKGVCLYSKITKAACNATLVKGFSKISDFAFIPTAPEIEVLQAGIETVPATVTSCAADSMCAASTWAQQMLGYTLVNAPASQPVIGACSYQKIVKACPAVPGYTVATDMDYSGGTISTLTGPTATFSVLAKACNQNAACKGFNSMGQLKNGNVPLAYIPGTCFYIKVGPKPPTHCPPVAGFTVTYYRNSPSGSYSLGVDVPTTANLADACKADPICKGFNTYGEGFYGIATLVEDTAVCLYQKTSPACKTFPGYDTIYNEAPVDASLYDFGDVNAAFAICQAQDVCGAFTSTGSIFSAIAGTTPTFGVCTYVKVRPVCPIVPGYAPVTDSDIEGNTISSAATILFAKAACDKNPNCQSFNSKGQLKSTSSPVATARGTCLFVKVPTTCPSVPGYTAIPDYNVLNATLRNFKTVDEALTFCDGKANCQGVSKLGAFVQAEPFQPIQYSRGSCYYNKSTTCPDRPGYKAIPNMAPAWTSLLSVNATDDLDATINWAFNMCNHTQECSGVSSLANSSTGAIGYMVKTTVANASDLTPMPGSCFYTKVATECREIRRGWEVETDRTIPTGTGYTKSMAQNWFGCAINGINTNESYYPPCYGVTNDVDDQGYFMVGLETTYTSVYKYGVCHWYKTTWTEEQYTQQISQNKKAYASSTTQPYVPARAVDGIKEDSSNLWKSQSSGLDDDLWLSVDTGDVWGITKVVLWNWDAEQAMLGADFGARIYYTNLTMMSRADSDAIDQVTVTNGTTYQAGVLLGDSTLLQTVLEQGYWETPSPGIARWVCAHKKISTASALAGNVTFGIQELEVYAIALPRLFRDDLTWQQRITGY